MRILVIGGGGREHALVWKLSQSLLCSELFCLPGNAGTGAICTNIDIGVSDYAAILAFAKTEKIDLVIIGPEQPLADGLSDMFRAVNIKVVGVSKAAARLESSKAFAKEFCFRHGIPCADSRDFVDATEAKAYISKVGVPIVIKADGLAAGKGVVVARDLEEAHAAVDMVMSNFGESGRRIVIEECLEGEELSFFALCDGEIAVPMLGLRDYKIVEVGGVGANTGGMGAYAPANFVDDKLRDKIMEQIAFPTLKGMQDEGSSFCGIMFMGLFVKNGEPRLIEYNVRFGDPECQVLMMLLENDLVEFFDLLSSGKLEGFDLRWRDGYVVNVVLASEGYPSEPVLGGKITLPKNFSSNNDVEIFHSGTGYDEKGNLVSSGGRVLGVTVYNEKSKEARDLAYNIVEKIKLKDSFYRDDISTGIHKTNFRADNESHANAEAFIPDEIKNMPPSQMSFSYQPVSKSAKHF